MSLGWTFPFVLSNQIRGTTVSESQGLKRAVTHSINSNFSFLNRISLLLISSRYLVALIRLSGPRNRPYISRTFSGIARNRTQDLLDKSYLLTTTPTRRSQLILHISICISIYLKTNFSCRVYVDQVLTYCLMHLTLIHIKIG